MSTPPDPDPATPTFTSLPDLAARSARGAVIWANDELFAEKENLITSGSAEFRPATFGHKGQVYDGWETRRRRAVTPDSRDCAIVRLAVPGIVRGVVIDTSWFTGNHPPQISVEGAYAAGHPSVDELVETTQWTTLVARTGVGGDTRNPFAVESSRRWSHVRLSIYPDGGVARFRVHGEALLDPDFADGMTLDLAALDNGGRITGCSNMFYGSPNNLLLPGTARTMGDGWETSRRRDGANDWVEVLLAGRGTVDVVELDTSYFVGNAPGAARLSGRDGAGDWFDLLAPTDLRPDTRHRFPIRHPRPVTDARLDVYPDGGMARLRLLGSLTSDGMQCVRERWSVSA